MNASEFTKAVRPIALANRNFNKIFCVGANKTGTTTLEFVLRLYGYQLPNQQEQEIRLTKRCFACDYSELVSFASRFDAFQDNPFSRHEIYAVADALFPNSKFILSERDPDSWFDSLVSFHKQQFGLDSFHQLTEADIRTKFDYLYDGYLYENFKYVLTEYDGATPTIRWDLLYDRDSYIKNYVSRNQRIKQYFQNCPQRLLIIDVTQEETTRKICDFLNIPAKFAVRMPQLNKS
jgi:hypothetical protein